MNKVFTFEAIYKLQFVQHFSAVSFNLLMNVRKGKNLLWYKVLSACKNGGSANLTIMANYTNADQTNLGLHLS